MTYQPLGSISALWAFGPQADVGPLGPICHAIWILTCTRIILYICNYYITYYVTGDVHIFAKVPVVSIL
jgi:hypothetical protein